MSRCIKEIFKKLVMEERVYYVYRHLRKDTGEPFYIGRGKKPAEYNSLRREYKRAYEYSGKETRSDYWKRIYNKHGRIVEILMEDLTFEESKQKEIEFIAFYGRDDKGGILCNRTDGGDGTEGYTHSEEDRVKMRTSAKQRVHPKHHTPEHNARIAESHKGKKRTSESKNKQSNSRKGKKLTPRKNKSYLDDETCYMYGNRFCF